MKHLFKKVVVAVLTFEASIALRKYRPKVVGVTGSVGKTSTKDAIHAVLASKATARKSEKSFNSEVGVPLTVLGLPNAWLSVRGWLVNILDGALHLVFKTPYPEWLVLEIGADRPKDIQSLCRWVRPDIAVLTRFPEVPVHVEFFGSRDAVLEEKRELRRALRGDGTLIVNADDAEVYAEPTREGQRKLSYGLSEHADVRAESCEVRYEDGAPVGMEIVVRFQNERISLPIHGVLGTHQVYPALAALAVGLSEGFVLTDMVAPLSALERSPGRMRLIPGRTRTTLIDDTYNASPIAVQAALDTLKGLITKGSRIAVLGDMMELGDFSVEEHRRVGTKAAECVHVFVAVGVRMREAAAHARANGMSAGSIFECGDAKEAAMLVAGILTEGDIVLVKGSQSMRMERVVEALMAEPERKKELLVRQDTEWEVR